MEETSQHPLPARFREIKGVLCLALSLFLFLCLFSFSPEDPSPMKFIGDPPSTRNWTGIVGSYTAGWMIFLLGLASFLLPASSLALAFQFFRRPEFSLKTPRVFGFLSLTLSLAALSDALIRGGVTVYGATFPSGGILGAGLVRFLQGYFNPAGTFILLIAWMMVSLFFIIDFSLVSTTEKFLQSVREGLSAFKGRAVSFFTGWFARATAEKSKDEKSRADPF